MNKAQSEFIRMVQNGLDADYVWSKFVDFWRESEWPEQSPEVKAYVSSLVKQYNDGVYKWRKRGQPKEGVSGYQQPLRDILSVLINGKPIPKSSDLDEVDIPF